MKKILFAAVISLITNPAHAGGYIGDLLNITAPSTTPPVDAVTRQAEQAQKSEIDSYHNVINLEKPPPPPSATPPSIDVNSRVKNPYGNYTSVCLTALGACPLPELTPPNTPCYCAAPAGAINGYSQ